ncbi:MAG: hypothetical protein GF387_03545 [Candidatus Portnoybacteria bacterium]|nr:hypothetical protein [Candidatus Portnoybacteria bacterium]
MIRIFIVNSKGKAKIGILFINQMIEECEKSAKRILIKEEKAFIEKVKKEDFFKELLKKLNMTEQEWINNTVKATIGCSKKGEVCNLCEKLIDHSFVEINLCSKCLKRTEELLKKEKLYLK